MQLDPNQLGSEIRQFWKGTVRYFLPSRTLTPPNGGRARCALYALTALTNLQKSSPQLSAGRQAALRQFLPLTPRQYGTNLVTRPKVLGDG